MSIRILQTVLLAAALVIGLTSTVFNGLSLIGLVLAGAAYYLGKRFGAKPAA